MSLHKFLKVLHIILALALPIFSLVVLGVINGLFAVQTSFWGEYIALLFLVYPIAIYGVYGGIIFLNFFPKKTSDALTLFIPAALSVGFVILQWQGWAVLQHLLFLEAVPTYLGIYACLIGGVSYLGWKKAKRFAQGQAPYQQFKTYALRGVVFLLLISPVIGTAIPLVRFSQDILHSLGWSTFGQGIYWIQVLVCIFIYYPKLVKLYFAEKL